MIPFIINVVDNKFLNEENIKLTDKQKMQLWLYIVSTLGVNGNELNSPSQNLYALRVPMGNTIREIKFVKITIKEQKHVEIRRTIAGNDYVIGFIDASDHNVNKFLLWLKTQIKDNEDLANFVRDLNYYLKTFEKKINQDMDDLLLSIIIGRDIRNI